MRCRAGQHYVFKSVAVFVKTYVEFCNLCVDVVYYLCQEERATDTKSTKVEQKFSKKPLDKPHTMWYNKGVKRARLSPAG